MADGSGKIALGAGLMSFGQGIGQAMDAAERRRQSLEEIRQRFQNSVALMDRREQMQMARDDREWERGAAERDARLGLLSAQADSYNALAEHRRQPDGGRNSSMFSTFDPDQYTPESVSEARRIEASGGTDAEAAAVLVRVNGKGGGMFDPNRVASGASDMADDLFGGSSGMPVPAGEQVSNFIESNPDMARQAGIEPTDSLPVAKRKFAEWYTGAFMTDPNAGRAGLMDKPRTPEAYNSLFQEDALGADIVSDLNRLLGQPGSMDDYGPAFDQWRN